MNTTIKISDKTKAKLEHLKMHKRESYNDIIERLVSLQDEDLDSLTIKNIRKSLNDIERGKVHTLSQVEKELGL